MSDVDARVAALVARVDGEWRRADYQERSFPAIAQRALGSGSVFGSASLVDILATLAVRESSVSRGETKAYDSISLFEGTRFSVRVHVSVDQLATLRSAGHGGACQVLAGDAVHGTFAFTAGAEYDASFALGALTRTSFQLLAAGDTFAVHPETIYGLNHLARSGACLRVESNEELGSRSVDFVAPGVLVDLDGLDPSVERRIRCFGAQYETDPEGCALTLESVLREEDPRTCFFLLHHAVTHFGAHLALDRLIDAARSSFGGHAKMVVDAFARIERTDALRRRLKEAVTPDERFLATALDWAEDSNDLTSMVAQRGPKDDPQLIAARGWRGWRSTPLDQLWNNTL